MTCTVLRCEKSAAHVLELQEPGMPKWETAVCAEHHYRITEGAPWSWVDGDGTVLMGDDLDSGGHLVPTNWTITDALGRVEIKIDCQTPSGKPGEAVKFLIPSAEREMWWKFVLSIDRP